jgi:diacylglycerol kinase
MYGHAKRVAASAVLIATVTSIATVTIWLQVLP